MKKNEFIGYCVSASIMIAGVIWVGGSIAAAVRHEPPKTLADLADKYGLTPEAAAVTDASRLACPTDLTSISEGQKTLCQVMIKDINSRLMTVEAKNATTETPAPTGNPNQPDTLSKTGKDTLSVSEAYDTEKPPANDLDKAIQLGHQWVDEGKRLIGKDKKDPMG